MVDYCVVTWLVIGLSPASVFLVCEICFKLTSVCVCVCVFVCLFLSPITFVVNLSLQKFQAVKKVFCCGHVTIDPICTCYSLP